MRTSVFKPLMITAIVAVFLGIGAHAFAHMDGGNGGYGMMRNGPMMNNGGYGSSGYGYAGNMSEEDFKAIEKARQSFFEDTADLRRELYAKELKLHSELVQETPDTATASGFQEEISNLRAKLDQKRLEHMVNVRKINPDAGRVFAGMGSMMGYGGGGMGSMMGHGGGGMGSMMGYGRQGGCW